jgi:hypothetical protein
MRSVDITVVLCFNKVSILIGTNTDMACCYRYRVVIIPDGQSVHVSAYTLDDTLLFARSARCSLALLPATITELADQVLRGEGALTAHAQLGGLLFEAVFVDAAAMSVRTRLAELQQIEPKQSNGGSYIRIELVLDDEAAPALAALPWEMIAVPDSLTLLNKTPLRPELIVVRRMPGAQVGPPPSLIDQLRLQIATTDAQAKLMIEQLVEHLPLPSQIRPVCLPPLVGSSATELQTTLERRQPHLLHLVSNVRARVSASGIVGGELSLAGSEGSWLTAGELAAIFANWQPCLVVIEALVSHRHEQRTALRALSRALGQVGVACVITIPADLSDYDRSRFLANFYTRFCRFEPVDLAAHASRLEIASQSALPMIALHSDTGMLVTPLPDLVAHLVPLDQPSEVTATVVEPMTPQHSVEDSTPPVVMRHPMSVREVEPLALPELMVRLSNEGHQALALALGESVRIGQFWLGLEFLLMGLSRQTGAALPNLLAELKVDASNTFRPNIRPEIMLSRDDQTWKELDVEKVGTEALPRLRTAESFVSGGALPSPHDPVITPRLLGVLRQAAALAGDNEPIGHAHLLLATMQHPKAMPVEWLFTLAHNAGWTSDQIRRRLEMLHNSPLDTIGSDLCVEARDGRLQPMIGSAHHRIVSLLIEVLARDDMPHPLIIGAHGVGKRTIVNGLATRLVQADANLPARLSGRRLILLPAVNIVADHHNAEDLAALLKRLIEVAQLVGPRTLIAIDALDALFTTDAAFIGLLRTAFSQRQTTYIATIKPEAYNQYIAADSQFAACFTPLWVEEPTDDEATTIVNALCEQWLQSRYRVRFAPDTAATAVGLAMRFPRGQQLPGRAIDIIEQSAQRIAKQRADEQRNREVSGLTLIDTVAMSEGLMPPLLQSEAIRLQGLQAQLAPLVSSDKATRIVEILQAAGHMGLRHPRAVLAFGEGFVYLAKPVAQVLARHLLEHDSQLKAVDLVRTSSPALTDDIAEWLRHAANGVMLFEGFDAAEAGVRQVVQGLCQSGRIIDSRGELADGRRAVLILAGGHWIASPSSGLLSLPGYNSAEIDFVLEAAGHMDA